MTSSTKPDVDTALSWLERHGSKRGIDSMARYAIPSDTAFGVSMKDIQKLAKILGRNHDLAEQLWQTNRYEARMLTAYVDEPERVTAAQMDRWCKDFDNWAICDTLCFSLFDRTPHAWKKVVQWSTKKPEFVKRAAFALMACVALHDKTAPDAKFRPWLPIIEKGASDERNFVKKGVSWALRAVGRRSKSLRAESIALAKRLASSEDPTERWVGKDVLRDLQKKS
jgi:3-methyladenine DNA glycosylase AlkD